MRVVGPLGGPPWFTEPQAGFSQAGLVPAAEVFGLRAVAFDLKTFFFSD